MIRNIDMNNMIIINNKLNNPRVFQVYAVLFNHKGGGGVYDLFYNPPTGGYQDVLPSSLRSSHATWKYSNSRLQNNLTIPHGVYSL